MARRATNGPTEAELEILQVLWEKGSATVGQVNEAVSALRPTGYTTTLKLMQIMTEKGLLIRDDSNRPHLFRPAASKEKTQRKLVKDLLKKAFDGSAAQLVLRALSSEAATRQELDEIRRVLDRLDSQKGPDADGERGEGKGQ